MFIPRKRQIKLHQPQLIPKEKAVLIKQIQQISQQQISQTNNDCSKLTNLMVIDLELTNENPTRYRNTTTDDVTVYQTINNNTNCDKTIVNVFRTTFGFGDYLRGCITLAHYAKYFGINFKMCMNGNHIFNYLNNSEEINNHSIDNIEEIWRDNNPKYITYYNLYLRIIKFMKSKQKCLYSQTKIP